VPRPWPGRSPTHRQPHRAQQAAPELDGADCGVRPRRTAGPHGRTPGGSRIIGYVAKALIAALDWKLDLAGAADPRREGVADGD